jgi:hypothetical protein
MNSLVNQSLTVGAYQLVHRFTPFCGRAGRAAAGSEAVLDTRQQQKMTPEGTPLRSILAGHKLWSLGQFGDEL